MGETLAVVAVLLVIVIAAFLVYVSSRPNTFRIERAASIKAAPERIFTMISDFHRWESWSPWEKLDLAMKKTHSGTASGKGAIYEWEGNKKVGKGRMEIIDTAPQSRITIKLDFFQPFEAHNIADFTLEPKGDATQVNWAMHGPNPFMMKMMGIFMNMDSMIGKDFEKGLANLKAVTET
jgi:uncharacterized protein YndB with AHSA1/START domain